MVRTSRRDMIAQLNDKIVPFIVKRMGIISEKPRNPVSVLTVDFIWRPEVEWGDKVEVRISERTEAQNGVNSVELL